VSECPKHGPYAPARYCAACSRKSLEVKIAELHDAHLEAVRLAVRYRDEMDRYHQSLSALADWVRGYAMTHDFQSYPRQLIDAEDLIDGKAVLRRN
jgi:hypothetical protein